MQCLSSAIKTPKPLLILTCTHTNIHPVNHTGLLLYQMRFVTMKAVSTVRSLSLFAKYFLWSLVVGAMEHLSVRLAQHGTVNHTATAWGSTRPPSTHTVSCRNHSGNCKTKGSFVCMPSFSITCILVRGWYLDFSTFAK